MKRSPSSVLLLVLTALSCAPTPDTTPSAADAASPACQDARLLLSKPGLVDAWQLREGTQVLAATGVPVDAWLVDGAGQRITANVDFGLLPFGAGHRLENVEPGRVRIIPGGVEELITVRAFIGANNVQGCVKEQQLQVRQPTACAQNEVAVSASAPGQARVPVGNVVRISIEAAIEVQVAPGMGRPNSAAFLSAERVPAARWTALAPNALRYNAPDTATLEPLVVLVTSDDRPPCTALVQLDVVDTPDVCAVLAPRIGGDLFGAATLRLDALQSVVVSTSTFPGQVTTYELLPGGVGTLVPGGAGATFTAPGTAGTATIRARVDAPMYRICTINQRVEVGAGVASSSSSGPPSSASGPQVASSSSTSQPAPSSALPSSSTMGGGCYPEVVFSQVHTVGGKAGAGYRQDFIELHNRTRAAFPLDGWFIQMRPAGTLDWTVMPLAGTMAAGGYFLVRLGSSGAVAGNTATPDQEFSAINLPDTDFSLMLLFAEHTGLMCPTTTREVASFVAASGNLVCTVGSAAVGTPVGAQSFTRNNDDVGCLHAYDSALNWRVAQVRSARNSQDPVSLCTCP